MYPLILAGGGGTRLWPVSREKYPKQLQALFGQKTLIQQTFERLNQGFKSENILISTNYQQVKHIQKQLPKLNQSNFILEPMPRGTAAAIGLAAFKIYQQDPTGILITINSDHYIKDSQEYIRVLKQVEQVVKDNPQQTVLVGIETAYPEVGYGYIERGEKMFTVGKEKIYKVKKFKEKPDIKTAENYFSHPDYFWNPAIFCWRVDYLIDLFKRYLPDQYKIFKKIQPAIGTRHEKKVLKTEFAKLQPVSIDYGIMEKTKEILMLIGKFEWLDIGHWRAVKEMMGVSQEDSVIKGKHIALESAGNLVYSESNKLVTTLGIKDLVIIDTPDILLICPKERSQEVKSIIAEIKKRGLENYL
ncbi:MAG: sugar phosphate nucleotidyltransferase [Patescibacteria group bacterium]|jgi:mannose-1-phosphate guanylyltransferase|nr:sugar phosphate nucleotidyltransferase [Patescibacteria group bacterium]